MKLFTAVVLAVSLAGVGFASADAPPAKPMHKPMAHHATMHHSMGHHMWPMCKEGMNKMACVCKGATAKGMCKAGQWCHTWAGACTM